MMRKFIYPAVIVFIAVLSFSFCFHARQSALKYKIIAYVAGWKDWSELKIEANKLTHINYAFATISKSGVLNPPKSSDVTNLRHLVSLKKVNPDLKVLISVGGWGAEYFSDVSLTEQSREKFNKSVIAFIKKYELDGVDLDWEYPGQPGAGNIFRMEDKENFTLLLKQLRKNLDEASRLAARNGNDKYLLTIATGGDKEYMKHTELGKAHQYLDFINIMTYDLYNGLDKETGHHSPLYQSRKGKQLRNSSEDAVNGHIEAGVPASKIVLGLPFYGRGWKHVKAEDNGLYQSAEGEHISLGYDSLKISYINKNGYVRYWDEEARAPYLWNAASRTFISYADEESFVFKADYVKKKGLGGVMFWEYSHDLHEGGLLKVLYEHLK
ncbi:MAG: glycoside hydrolase family 18 protein [Cytophagaceae bacterium]